MSSVMCHVSGVRCQVSHVRCHMSLFFFLFYDKVAWIVSRGSVINGAPSSVQLNEFVSCSLFIFSSTQEPKLNNCVNTRVTHIGTQVVH